MQIKRNLLRKECFAKENVKRFSCYLEEGGWEWEASRNTRHKYHKVRRRKAKQIKLLHNECKNELHFSISVSVLLAALVVATVLVVVVEHSKNNSREK